MEIPTNRTGLQAQDWQLDKILVPKLGIRTAVMTLKRDHLPQIVSEMIGVHLTQNRDLTMINLKAKARIAHLDRLIVAVDQEVITEQVITVAKEERLGPTVA